MGKYGEAAKIVREVIEERGKIFPPSHLGILRAQTDLAELLHKQGQQEEAENMLRECIACHLDHVPLIDHYHFVYVLARTLDASGKHQEALEHYHRAFCGLQKLLGAEHPETIRCTEALERALNKTREMENVYSPEGNSKLSGDQIPTHDEPQTT